MQPDTELHGCSFTTVNYKSGAVKTGCPFELTQPRPGGDGTMTFVATAPHGRGCNVLTSTALLTLTMATV